jgi:hypothetical protein
MYTRAAGFRRNAGWKPDWLTTVAFERNTVTSLRKPDACKTLAARVCGVMPERAAWALQSDSTLPLASARALPTLALLPAYAAPPGCTSCQRERSTYWRASISRFACLTASSFTV